MLLRHRFVPRLAEVDAVRWDALRGSDDPFTSHAFLSGLEETGCLRPRWGWNPHHLLIENEAGELQAAAPCYLKTNSHGEFVFDHAWADAYFRAGLDYFPKLLVAVPYSPVTGPRLLCAGDAGLRTELLRALESFASEHRLSGAHINFHPIEDVPDGAWLARTDLQFHWHNTGYACFEDFLAALSSKKRKNLRQERAQVARAGIRLRRVHGDAASEEEIAVAHRLYCRTFDDKGNHAALTLDFFRHLARALGRGLLLVLAERGDEVIAMALCLRSADTLYGRYWGCIEARPFLHFNVCYYHSIAECIHRGVKVFEGGAGGDHKLARGFEPAVTGSAHWIFHPGLSRAIGEFVGREREAVLAELPALAEASGLCRPSAVGGERLE